MANPWASPAFEPRDPRARALALRVIAECGGSGLDVASVDVVAGLQSWYQRTIPDLLGHPLDADAIDSQAHFLQQSEGNSLADWAAAVVEQFRTHSRWTGCHEQRLHRGAYDFRFVSQQTIMRGMCLYSMAFRRVAAEMGISSLRVYRVLPTSRSDWTPNAIANVSWGPEHFTPDGMSVRSTDISPALVVGITLIQECHPLITPFDITTGPGRNDVVFTNAGQ